MHNNHCIRTPSPPMEDLRQTTLTTPTSFMMQALYPSLVCECWSMYTPAAIVRKYYTWSAVASELDARHMDQGSEEVGGICEAWVHVHAVCGMFADMYALEASLAITLATVKESRAEWLGRQKAMEYENLQFFTLLLKTLPQSDKLCAVINELLDLFPGALGSIGPSSDANISKTSPVRNGFFKSFLLDLDDEPIMLSQAFSSFEDRTMTSVLLEEYTHMTCKQIPTVNLFANSSLSTSAFDL
ncbi:hypothetical protein EV702DRAFT_1046322 [Suillus placidus]|uniref:Uncharacterized protein n=1 Tax=Suillus placidus TaxID=48579 RepID=A0A9P6ZSW8_9AGAM|nr:hypothetical protein EV702DRAFT_1046322 [Suillus placidus]